MDDDPGNQLIADIYGVEVKIIDAHRCKTPPPVLPPDFVAEDVKARPRLQNSVAI